MKSSPPRLNPKTDLIVSRYLRFPAFFFGRFLPQTCPFAQTFRFISAAPACPLAQTFRFISSAPAVSSRQFFLIFVLTKNFRNAIYSPT